MEELELWEMEAAEIEASCSPEAMVDLWAETLAGLANVEDERLEELAAKALALAQEERHRGLGWEVEVRIDEIVAERRAQAQEKRRKLLGTEGE